MTTRSYRTQQDSSSDLWRLSGVVLAATILSAAVRGLVPQRLGMLDCQTLDSAASVYQQMRKGRMMAMVGNSAYQTMLLRAASYAVLLTCLALEHSATNLPGYVLLTRRSRSRRGAGCAPSEMESTRLVLMRSPAMHFAVNVRRPLSMAAPSAEWKPPPWS